MRLIRDGDTIATGGFVGIGFAEEIAVALEALYLSKDEETRSDRTSRETSRWSTPRVRATARSADSITSATKAWCGA